MTDYKLVPVEPTSEMLAAGEYALEAGCYASGIYADMLAAAPAVQGEPQPAEQHPEAVREGAPYDDPAFESLCREHEIWGTAAAAQCALFWEAGKRVAEQKPDPDYIEYEILRRAMSNMGLAARDALAAYRKQGGEK